MKRLSLLFLMSMAATTLYSQITFTPKAGASMSHMSLPSDFADPGEDYTSKIGLIVGVAVEIPLMGELLSVQPELLFHQKGFKYKWESAGEMEEYKYTLNYIELPILAKVKFGKFYAVAGPSFGYGIGGKWEGKYTYSGGSESYSGKVKFGERPSNSNSDDDYFDNALDICIQVGAGIKVSVVVIELRYGFGVTNVDDVYGGYTGSWKSKNGSLQLTVGVPLGGKK
ncbi:MAG: PorT family protein [Cyclobacteriaceae bacterium]|nr:PorT family protein [Cyclobacteriaceae bacterium]